MKYPIPESALAQHTSVLGKTSTAKTIVGHLVAQGARGAGMTRGEKLIVAAAWVMVAILFVGGGYIALLYLGVVE